MPYQSKLPAYPHQQDALDKMNGRAAFALLMAMRTGKTKTTIDDFGQLEFDGKVDDLLVLAPNGVYRTWKGEFEKHASDDLQKRARLFVWETKKNQAEALEYFMQAEARTPRVLLANIEATSNVERVRKLLERYVGQRRCMVVIDESTTIKGWKSRRTKFVTDKLKPRSAFRRILSGLPTPNSPLDAFSQFNFLDPRIIGVRNYFEFKGRYAVTRKITNPYSHRLIDVVVGYRNVEHLQKTIAPYSYRIRLEDIVDLPSSYTPRHVELTEEQEKVYEELKQLSIAELEDGGVVSAPMVIVRMLRLHQILTGHVRDADGEVREIPEKRTASLLQLLEEYDGKAVIWCSYDHSVRKIRDALVKDYGEDSVACFWGGNASTREEDDERFRTDPKCRFMIATPGSGGRGRRWFIANLVVYYSNTHNLEHRDQSEERAKDMEKTDHTLYVDLMTPGTVDEIIIDALRNKIDLSRKITGDDVRQWLV